MRDMSTPPHTVYFLPWLDLRSVLSIGPVTFWPYYLLADERIADRGIKVYLDKLFASFLDRRRNPVRTITICSYDGIDFQLFTQEQFNHLTWAINSLMLAAITALIPEDLRLRIFRSLDFFKLAHF